MAALLVSHRQSGTRYGQAKTEIMSSFVPKIDGKFHEAAGCDIVSACAVALVGRTHAHTVVTLLCCLTHSSHEMMCNNTNQLPWQCSTPHGRCYRLSNAPSTEWHDNSTMLAYVCCNLYCLPGATCWGGCDWLMRGNKMLVIASTTACRSNHQGCHTAHQCKRGCSSNHTATTQPIRGARLACIQ